jgi:hypothetical protein
MHEPVRLAKTFECNRVKGVHPLLATYRLFVERNISEALVVIAAGDADRFGFVLRPREAPTLDPME